MAVIFTPLPLAGAFLIEPEPRTDDRGSFARLFCTNELAARGLESRVAQCNAASNRRRGTLRGLHYQREPHAEVKIVRCTQGEVFDVMVDLRPASPTRYRWWGGNLAATDGRMAYVPRGFAHGYLTLTDGAELLYLVSEHYAPEAEAGVRWDDPQLAIRWPIADPLLSEKDASWPLIAAAVDEEAGR